MRILKLSANKSSFKTVEFRRTGLSLILGRRSDTEVKGSKKTFNGVGKSLVITLLDFCLGSKPIDAFKVSLPEWVFYLDIELDGQKYVISRTTDDTQQIEVNGVKKSQTAFNEWMNEKVFNIASPVPYLTFRSLIRQFLRPNRDSYSNFLNLSRKETAFHSLLRVSFFLGLDLERVKEKCRLKQELDETMKARKRLQEDSFIKKHFVEGEENVEFRLRDLKIQASKLQRDLDDFEVAEDYHEIEQKANQARSNVQTLRNETIILQNAMANITKSLELRPDLNLESVVRLYEESAALLPESLVKSVKDVQSFHQKLLANRLKRLSKDRKELSKRLTRVEKERIEVGKKLDSYLQFLGAHRALDEYVTVSNRLSQINGEIQKLKSYEELVESYNDKLQDLKVLLAEENKEAGRYLRTEAASITEAAFSTFRRYATALYPNCSSGLTITNNEGENQLRFNVSASIESDQADGISNMKIFCFDLTLLAAKDRHNVEFLVHDSRLFNATDPRQISEAFKLAQEFCTENDTQYIATLNEDQLSLVKEALSEEEFNRIMDDNIVLNLTDDGPKGKLLGIQVDMKYDES